jgi:dephospho-CoA kinase
MTTIPDRIANVLAPHLGPQSADVVARHICAKYSIDESAGAEKLQRLGEFLRRGLVAYVGHDAAGLLAAECVRQAKETSGAAG